MTDTRLPLVKQAVEHFRHGRYQQAKACYQQAATRYGEEVFMSAVQLCEWRLNGAAAWGRPASTGEGDAARQLEETQKLLEHYYQRCQELEYLQHRQVAGGQ